MLLEHDISDYSPVPLKVASLDFGEIHHHSFFLTECEKGFFSYKTRPLVMYYCHLTNKRVLIEPREVKNWEAFLANAAVAVGSQFIQSHAVEFQLKHDVKQNINTSKARNKAGIFQIPYSDIKEFKLLKQGLGVFAKIILNSPPKQLGDDGLVFAASVFPRNKMDEFFTFARRGADFVVLGNRCIADYRECCS